MVLNDGLESQLKKNESVLVIHRAERTITLYTVKAR